LITVYPLIFLYGKISKNNLSKHTGKLLLLPKVIKGELSMVGIPLWFEMKNNDFPGKKGLTGLIQINFYKEISQEELENYNLFYAKNHSIMLDVEILLKTIFSFFKKSN